MATLRWKQNRFRITRHPLTPALFDAWLAAEGGPLLRNAVRNTRVRWLLGPRRARRRLRRGALTAFRPGGTFCTTMLRQLNRLPVVVRGCAIGVHNAGHRELCTYDAAHFLSAVPRGVVQNDFRILLIREAAHLPQVRMYDGLAHRVLGAIAVEAETALFDSIVDGRPLVDETGRGMLLGGDREFRWRLDGVDGHYYYAGSLDEAADLTERRAQRRFVAEVHELLHGQAVHLKRMRPEEIAETADGFRLRRGIGTGDGQGTMTIRVRKTRETTEEILLTRS